MARPRQIDDDKLLQRAMMVFWQNGFGATGIRELEDATGLRAPSLYNRFGSKEGLFEAALEHYLQMVVGWRVRHFLEGADAVPPDDRDRKEAYDKQDALAGLRRFLETTYDYADSRHPAMACLLVNTSMEMGGTQGAVDAVLLRGAQKIRAGFEHNLQRLQRDGRLPADADISAHAEHLQLCLQGLLVSSRMDEDKASLARKVGLILSTLPLIVPATSTLPSPLQSVPPSTLPRKKTP